MKPLPLQREGRVAWRRLAAATKVDGYFALATLGERAARSAG